ncbi:MAG: hypothetical protein NTZ09_19860 [Candidatus Hydrogenedentes bacterium]|nr:hypothetical protein [Candidatus Hydrogenedentota bacterium]
MNRAAVGANRAWLLPVWGVVIVAWWLAPRLVHADWQMGGRAPFYAAILPDLPVLLTLFAAAIIGLFLDRHWALRQTGGQPVWIAFQLMPYLIVVGWSLWKRGKRADVILPAPPLESM